MNKTSSCISENASYRERLCWHLTRLDTLTTNADSKSTIVLGLDGAITAAVFTVDSSILINLADKYHFVWLLMILLGVSLCLSMFFATYAIMPQIKTRCSPVNRPSSSSIYHFATVAEMDMENFRKEYRNLNKESDLDNIETMVYICSKIATSKFRKLQLSVASLFCTIICGVLLVAVDVIRRLF